MDNWKRIASVLQAAVLLFVILAACAEQSVSEPQESVAELTPAESTVQTEQENEPSSEASPEPSSDTPEKTEPEPAVSSAAGLTKPEVPAQAGPDYYYLDEEVTTITMLFQYPFFFASFFPEGWGQSPIWDEIQQKLNVELELIEVMNTTYVERLNLMLVAGEAPDILSSVSGAYSTGLSGAQKDEVILDIAPLLEENAPNYWYYMNLSEATRREVTGDNGAILAMYSLTNEAVPYQQGLWYREDWLSASGLSVPSDPDSLYDFLKFSKTEYGAESPLYQMVTVASVSQGAGMNVEGVWNAFGPVSYYLDDADQVQFGAMQDYYYDYLRYLQKLAGEELFLTSEMTDATSNELFARGDIAVNGDSPDNIPDYLALLDEDGANMRAMSALGDPTKYGNIETLINSDGVAIGEVSINFDAENPGLILKMLDYFFTDEGSLLASYGIENLSYEYVDGKPQFTDLIINNPDGVPTRATMGYYCLPGLPGLIESGRTAFNWEPYQAEAYDIWAAAYTGSSGTLPVGITFTEEELNKISVFRTDMYSYINEQVYIVIFGGDEINDAWIDSFRNTLVETMHIDEILEVYNASYERYLNR